jgi:hypothetical protein
VQSMRGKVMRASNDFVRRGCVSLTFASPCARGVGEASVARVRSDRAEQRRYPADECTALAGEQREVGEFHDPSDGKCLRGFRRYTAHRE